MLIIHEYNKSKKLRPYIQNSIEKKMDGFYNDSFVNGLYKHLTRFVLLVINEFYWDCKTSQNPDSIMIPEVQELRRLVPILHSVRPYFQWLQHYLQHPVREG